MEPRRRGVFPSSWSSLLSFITSPSSPSSSFAEPDDLSDLDTGAPRRKNSRAASSIPALSEFPPLYDAEKDRDRLILLGNGLSQPARAVMWFLEVNNIPYDFRLVRIMNGQHLTDQFAAINPLRKVPVLIDHGDIICESHTILRYLSLKFNVADHWYPRSDLLKRTKIDTYLDWHHLGLRKAVVAFLSVKFLGHDDVKALARTTKEVQNALDILSNVWLTGGKKYLMGEEISIADLPCVCELMQLRLTEGGLGKRPQLQAYMERMVAWPGFDKVHSDFLQFVQMKNKGNYVYREGKKKAKI